MNAQKNFRLSDLIFAILNILFFIGITFVFHACGPKADGSWMTCHYAQNIIKLSSVIGMILSIINIFVNAQIKLGIYISTLAISIGTIFVPGKLIPLCMMNDMRCNAITKPCTIIFAVIIALSSLSNLIFTLLKLRKQNQNEISK